MGTGAVFGLASSLVGEALPGSGPAIATGNALADGPVVFYWPQEVIDELEDKAKHDVASEWAQLRVDLFRQASRPPTTAMQTLRPTPACQLTNEVTSTADLRRGAYPQTDVARLLASCRIRCPCSLTWQMSHACYLHWRLGKSKTSFKALQ